MYGNIHCTPPLVKPTSLMAVTLSSAVFRDQLLFFDVSHNSCCVEIDHPPKFQVSYICSVLSVVDSDSGLYS